MRKDPALITRHIKEKEELKKDKERVIAVMRERKANVNSQQAVEKLSSLSGLRIAFQMSS